MDINTKNTITAGSPNGPDSVHAADVDGD